MTDNNRVAILGVGYFVPANIRTNDDPIFDWLHNNPPPGQDLFTGFNERHVLGDNETVMTLLVPAAQRALAAAGLTAQDVDVLIGVASVGAYLTPNDLAQLHAELNLPNTTWVIPLNDDFTNFNSGVMLAHSLAQTYRARNALVVCGGNWTRFVNYHTPESVSAADGAGAAVIGRTPDTSHFSMVDAIVDVESRYYGVMYMAGDAVKPSHSNKEATYTAPTFHITPAGFEAFRNFGMNAPIALARRLLARNHIVGGDVALITHQASSVLMTAWRQAIQPGQYINTIATFANMTVATLPVNLAFAYDTLARDYVVLLGIGVQPQTAAVLLRRNG